MPKSATNAAPCGRMRASAVGVCVAIPDMVAGRNHIHAAVQKFARNLDGQSIAGGGVFALRGYKIYAELAFQVAEQRGERAATAASDHIADH